MRRLLLASGLAVLLSGLAACAPKTGILTVVRGNSVGLPAGYYMAVVATGGSRPLGTSQGPVAERGSNVDAWSTKPGDYQVRVGYYACDQSCAVADIPAHVRAAQASCDLQVKVARGKTTRITAAYASGSATCVSAPPR